MSTLTQSPAPPDRSWAPPASAKIRVLVIDDHPVVCEALAVAIREDHALVHCGSACTAAQGLELVEEHRPDVVVVDLSLGDAHGLSLVQELRERHPRMRVIIYSMHNEAAYAERAIRAGALAYVSKTEPPGIILEAIHKVCAGVVYLNRSLALRMLSSAFRSPAKSASGSLDRLTNRELAVVQLLGMGHGIGKIAQTLNLNVRTVQAYQRRAMGKLGHHTVGELLKFAMSVA